LDVFSLNLRIEGEPAVNRYLSNWHEMVSVVGFGAVAALPALMDIFDFFTKAIIILESGCRGTPWRTRSSASPLQENHSGKRRIKM